MNVFQKPLHIILIVLTSFLALTAVLGGLVLLTGSYAPPVEMLNGSMFSTYTIPALSLAVLVGGSAVFAAILLPQEQIRYSVCDHNRHHYHVL
jgi:hypothetical protein